MASPSRRPVLTLEDYYNGVIARDMAVLPRALTLIESAGEREQQLAEQLLTRLMLHTGGAIRIGITGPPGVGKSTFIESLGMHLTGQGRHVAVLAVDPSSQATGGSILGDKTRMARLSGESNAFIRPSPTAGTLGGVASKTRESLLVLEAARFDVVLVETVGVGQSEYMVANMTDCFLALMLSGAGDELQGIKRGLLEFVDVIAVNKADDTNRDAAEFAAEQLRHAIDAIASQGDTPVSVLTCSARDNQGIEAVWKQLAAKHDGLSKGTGLAERRSEQQVRWLWDIVDGRLRQMIRENNSLATVKETLEQQVRNGQLAPEIAARKILDAFRTDK